MMIVERDENAEWCLIENWKTCKSLWLQLAVEWTEGIETEKKNLIKKITSVIYGLTLTVHVDFIFNFTGFHSQMKNICDLSLKNY